MISLNVVWLKYTTRTRKGIYKAISFQLICTHNVHLYCRESAAGASRGAAQGSTSMGSSTLVPDRSSTPVATEYADDVAGEALGGDDDASETDEPNIPAPVPPPDAQHHDDAMGDR